MCIHRHLDYKSAVYLNSKKPKAWGDASVLMIHGTREASTDVADPLKGKSFCNEWPGSCLLRGIRFCRIVGHGCWPEVAVQSLHFPYWRCRRVRAFFGRQLTSVRNFFYKWCMVLQIPDKLMLWLKRLEGINGLDWRIVSYHMLPNTFYSWAWGIGSVCGTIWYEELSLGMKLWVSLKFSEIKHHLFRRSFCEKYHLLFWSGLIAKACSTILTILVIY